MIYLAIHIVTESSDHYQRLIEVEDVTREQIESKLNISESPEYWSDFYVDAFYDEDILPTENILREMISEAQS